MGQFGPFGGRFMIGVQGRGWGRLAQKKKNNKKNPDFRFPELSISLIGTQVGLQIWFHFWPQISIYDNQG